MEVCKEYKGVVISLSFKRSDLKKTSINISEIMFTIELLNQLRNDNHYISPMIIDPGKSTFNSKPCRLPGNETIVCAFYFVTVQDLGIKYEQYLKNDCLYFRISQTKFVEAVWHAYEFCGPSIFNMMLDQRAIFMWKTIGLLILFTVHNKGAWLNAGQTVIYVLTFVLFILHHHVIANS